MKEIICKIHMGTKEQEVFIYSKETKDFEVYKMAFNAIPDFIATHDDIEDIYLYGPKNYVKKIELDTYKLEERMYTKGVKSKFHYA